MKKMGALFSLIGLLGLTGAASPLWAEEGASASSSPHGFAPNVGLVSDYIFRGLSQTWRKPALQAGVDYTHTSGWYAGVWGSTISDRQFAGGSVELDLTGGYNGKFNDDWSWTVGLAGAHYPGADFDKVKPAGSYGSQSYDNLEVNAGIGYQWITAKLSVALSDYFGANSKSGYTGSTAGSAYLDLTATVPLPEPMFGKDVTLPLHIGRTHYTAKLAFPANNGGANPDYTDYKIGIAKTFDGGWSAGLAATYADNDGVYKRVPSAKDLTETADLGGLHWVLSVTKTF